MADVTFTLNCKVTAPDTTTLALAGDALMRRINRPDLVGATNGQKRTGLNVFINNYLQSEIDSQMQHEASVIAAADASAAEQGVTVSE